jgi:hypothetical protein
VKLRVTNNSISQRRLLVSPRVRERAGRRHPRSRSTSDFQGNRRGVTLTEILIGIMVLGIGVISLATLFPIGLLRMKRAVNDVRGTIEARSAWNESRVRNLLAPPLGPLFNVTPAVSSVANLYSPLSADPGGVDGNVIIQLPGKYPFRPTVGPGIPVVIDPLWMIQNGFPTSPMDYRLGVANLDRLNGDNRLDFLRGGEGLFRTAGGITSASLAQEIFSSADDLVFGDAEDRRILPFQAPSGAATPPPYLSPTYGNPFYGNSLARERRYTWLMIARKVSANQIYSPGYDGAVGSPFADDYDLLDNHGPESGADGVLGYLPPAVGTLPGTKDDPTYDDPARDMVTGLPVPAPVGPFDVTIVVFYNRDLSARDIVYTNYTNLSAAQPANLPPIDPIFSPVPRMITVGGATYGPFGINEATLVRRGDGIPFPEITIGSYVLDSTFDGSFVNVTLGPRGGQVYRVVNKALIADGDILVLSLDRPARPNGAINGVTNPAYYQASGYVLTHLKGAVSVFEKQIP